ncbi:hypothetical protein NN561_018697 [Cricetulus griseus]
MRSRLTSRCPLRLMEPQDLQDSVVLNQSCPKPWSRSRSWSAEEAADSGSGAQALPRLSRGRRRAVSTPEPPGTSLSIPDGLKQGQRMGHSLPTTREKRLRSSCAGGSLVGVSPERRDWGRTPGMLLILHWGLLRLMREGCLDLPVTGVYQSLR